MIPSLNLAKTHLNLSNYRESQTNKMDFSTVFYCLVHPRMKYIACQLMRRKNLILDYKKKAGNTNQPLTNLKNKL